MVNQKGYVLITLLFAVFILALGMMVAIPVWQTQIQREKEEELIFRGKQYVEAIRLYQLKKPGRYPSSLEELLEEKCIRRLYKDPMVFDGQWNLILPYSGGGSARRERVMKKVYVVPPHSLSSFENPRILGVVSSSTRASIKICHNQTSYEKWFFFLGQDPKSMPEIVYFDQEED